VVTERGITAGIIIAGWREEDSELSSHSYLR